MGKLFKFLFLVALVAALAGGGSYAAAYFAQGKITGVDDPLGARRVRLVYRGYDSLPGKPRVWIFGTMISARSRRVKTLPCESPTFMPIVARRARR